jgi:hypothetical protein
MAADNSAIIAYLDNLMFFNDELAPRGVGRVVIACTRDKIKFRRFSGDGGGLSR